MKMVKHICSSQLRKPGLLPATNAENTTQTCLWLRTKKKMRYFLSKHPMLFLGLECTECRGCGPTKPKAPSQKEKVAAQITFWVYRTVRLRTICMNGMMRCLWTNTLSSAMKVIFQHHKSFLPGVFNDQIWVYVSQCFELCSCKIEDHSKDEVRDWRWHNRSSY